MQMIRVLILAIAAAMLGAGTTWAVQPCSVDADCDDGNNCTDDTCQAGACVRTPNVANCGPAIDVPIQGRKLKLQIPPSAPDRRGMRLLTNNGALNFANLPVPLTSNDPVKKGGSIRLFTNVGDHFDHTYPLPLDHWNYFPLFHATDYRGYYYRDQQNLVGPFGFIKIRAGVTMRLHGKDKMVFSLAADPDPVNIVLAMGNIRYCLAMGGAKFNFNANALYWSKESPAPAACPCSIDSDCDDGLACDGTETCVNGFCQAGVGVCPTTTSTSTTTTSTLP